MRQAGAEHKLYDPAFIRSLRPFDQEVDGLVTKVEQDYRAALAIAADLRRELRALLGLDKAT